MFNEDVKILEHTVVSEGRGTLARYVFSIVHSDGNSYRHEREIYKLQNAAAVLLYNSRSNTVVLVKQFRFPIYLADREGMQIEVCAGLIDSGSAEETARREVQEETGYDPRELRHVLDSHISPGSVTQKVSLFFAEYDDDSRMASGGGLKEEGEDIEVIELPFSEAMRMVSDGIITDAKTIMLLQLAAIRQILR